jgi:bifunctional DNA-binding transcriptional regulator/antitoxin component of YhaV-PrlF toxin-antitoxin module
MGDYQVTMASEGKVARKFALYPPKTLINQLGLKEGQRVRYEIQDGRLVVEPLPDPIEVALRSKKWMKARARDIELASEREQVELYA